MWLHVIAFLVITVNGDCLNIPMIPCNKTFDICEIKSMAAPFITFGYVNNYEKNRYL